MNNKRLWYIDMNGRFEERTFDKSDLKLRIPTDNKVRQNKLLGMTVDQRGRRVASLVDK